MQSYSAEVFYQIGGLLDRLRNLTAEQTRFDVKVANNLGIGKQQKKLLAKNSLSILELTEVCCMTIDLRQSLKLIRRLKASLQNNTLDPSQIQAAVAELHARIGDEIEDHLFLHVPLSRADMYNKSRLFGEGVADKFPSVYFDVWEAGNCFAVGRFTACVFHLMRVLEIGLTVLGKVFDVSLAHTNWAPAIEQIESKIREMHKDPRWKALPDCKEQQEFYAQATSHLGMMKDAWRNYTAHARGKCTEEEAAGLMLKNVKAFMQKLSERLAE